MTSKDARQLLDDVFQEEALIIGGLAELHGVDDEVIDRLIRSLAVVRSKAHQRINEPNSLRGQRKERPKPHPTIEQFLMQIGKL